MIARLHPRLVLFPVVALAASCAAPEPGEPLTTSKISSAALAERRALATRGHLTAITPNPTVVPAALGDDLVASLDISPDLHPTFVSLDSPDPAAALVRTNYGHLLPRKGSSFLLLSTGKSGNDALTAEPGFDFPPAGADRDFVTLQFQVTVPPGINRMSFDYDFLSAEAPEFIGGEFNDTFTARVSDGFGANREIASAQVNSAAFHPISELNDGVSPFLLYVEDPAGTDDVFGAGTQVDAGTTGFQRVDVAVSEGVVTIVLDIRDAGDGFFDSAVLVDNLAFSRLEAVDPHADLVDDFGQVFPSPDPRLVTRGAPIHSVAADGVTQVVLRSNVAGPGQISFVLDSGAASDGTLSPLDGSLAWASSASVPAQLIAGKWYAFALFRGPPDFNRGAGDVLARRREAAMTVTYTPSPASAAGFIEHIVMGIERPPVVVVPDLWSSCASWKDHGSILDPHPELDPDGGIVHPFTVACADYASTMSKSLTTFGNRSAVSFAINEVFDALRGTGIAVTRADVIGHGMGGVLARRYIDEFGFLARDNFNAGRINRLITLDTPHLGSRLLDEMVRFRDALKVRDPAGWAHVKDLLDDVGIDIDDADGDVAVDELQTTSPTINAIGTIVVPPRNVAYHAMISGAGRDVPRATGIGLVPTNVKTLYIQMENNHPATFRLTVPQRQKLIFGNQSLIFCNDNQAAAADQHDLAATIWEQQGGLDVPFITTSEVDPGSAVTDHYQIELDRSHSETLLGLLGAPVGGGLFSPTMPSPGAIARINSCPIVLPAPLAPPVRALVAPAIAITSPAPGTRVTAGRAITVAIDTGDRQPDAVLIVVRDNAVLLEQPPFTTSFVVPATAVDALSLRAVAFYGQGEMAFAAPVDLAVDIDAALVAIEPVSGNVLLQRPGRTRQLAVTGVYSDGVRRDITRARGTQYDSSSLTAVADVSATGLITALAPGNATIVIRNGSVVTSINAKVGAPACGDEVVDPGEDCDDGNLNNGDGCDSACQSENRAPVAVCDSPTRCNDPGRCFATATDLGARSFDPDGDPLSITQTPLGPYSVGPHAVSVQVSDGALAAQCVSQLTVRDCEPPALSCPASFTAECTGQRSATIVPPPASATDNCSATIQPPTGGRLPLGATVLTYRASDPAGNPASCNTTVTVADTLPPAITCPAPIVAECTGRSGAFVTPGAAKASDVCTAVSVTRPAAAVFSLGTTTLGYTASDETGHKTSCASTIRVVDTTPPYVSVGYPAPLAPADHRYHTVSLDDCGIVVEDACGGQLTPAVYHPAITCVTANEPDDAPGHGDGDTTKDIVLVDDTTLKLRAERADAGHGRVYRVHFQVRDSAGNRQDGTCRFVVPHDATASEPVTDDDSIASSVCRP